MGQEVLRFELAPAGDGGCQMIFINVTAERDIAVEAAAGWHAGLEVLEAHLDGAAVAWDAFERAGELVDDYAGVG